MFCCKKYSNRFSVIRLVCVMCIYKTSSKLDKSALIKNLKVARHMPSFIYLKCITFANILQFSY